LLLSLGLLNLCDSGHGLGASGGSSPVLLDLVSAVVVVSGNRRDQLAEGTLVLRVGVDDCHARSGLPVHNAAETSLVLDDAVWHLHLSAQGGQKQNDLNRIDITGNDNQLRFLLFDEGGDGVDSVTDNGWPLGSLGLLVLAVLGLLLSALAKAVCLLLLGLWAVLVQKLEQLGGLIDFAASGLTTKQPR